MASAGLAELIQLGHDMSVLCTAIAPAILNEMFCFTDQHFPQGKHNTVQYPYIMRSLTAQNPVLYG